MATVPEESIVHGGHGIHGVAIAIPAENELDQCRRALDQATRYLEQARCQEAELEAWTVFGAALLKAPPGNLHPDESLPPGIQDGMETIGEVTATGMTSLPPPASATNNGQWATAVHRTVQAYSIQRMAEQAQTVVTERILGEAALLESVATLKKQRDPNLWLQLLDERLQALKVYHALNPEPTSKKRRLGNPSADGFDLSADVLMQLQSLQSEETLYSPDEVLGKYLDLCPLYQQALREELLAFLGTQPHYVEFLQALSKGRLGEFDKVAKRRKKFIRFLSGLQAYLESYLQRTAPLLDLQQFRDSELGEQSGSNSNNELVTTIDLSAHASADDLASAVDADVLKNELVRLGLKCGGTPLDRAKRLWLLKSANTLSDLPKSVLAPTNHQVSVSAQQRTVQALLDQVQPVLEATIRRTERRQGQNLSEREREVLEELYGAAQIKKEDNADSDDDAPIYNPKNIPLDWDGKPIPYWLFKLHGLNHYYPCEICGGESYRGRRNFELHFAEQKHAAGMKSLGIPNTKHFHGVTSIDDAQLLWKSLQVKLQGEAFDGTQEEEYEDSHGNVLSRTTYEDLARQGLL